MGLFDRKPPVAPQARGHLPEDQVQLIRAEAITVVKQHLRAEAKAQATIAKKEMADQANVLFKRIDERFEKLENKIGLLADVNTRLLVIVDVLRDLLVDGSIVRDWDRHSFTADRRRQRIDELCQQKKALFEAEGPSH